MTIAAGANIEADDIAAIDTEVSQKGFVVESVRTTASANFTTTEVVIQSVTFTAIAGVRYKITAVQAFQSNVANDLIQVRLRIQSGPTLTTGGTQIRSSLPNCDVAARGNVSTLVGTVTGLSGQHTVGITAVRTAGTGNCSSFGSAAMEDTILVEAM